MSDDNEWDSEKVLEQIEAHRDICEEHYPEVANYLVSRSLQRHGVFVTPDQVDAWATINQAAGTGKLSIQHELARAQAKADHVADLMASKVSGNQAVSPWAGHDSEEAAVQGESWGEELGDDQEDEWPSGIAEQDEGWCEDIDDDDQEEERPSLSEIFGYDNDEDNEEAAYDHILKLTERDDD